MVKRTLAQVWLPGLPLRVIPHRALLPLFVR